MCTMSSTLAGQLEELLAPGEGGAVRVPALVKGQLRYPSRVDAASLKAGSPKSEERGAGPRWFTVDGAYLVQQRTWSNPTGVSSIVLPRVDPSEIVEREPARLARTLYNLPFREVESYVTALRTHLLKSVKAVRSALLGTSVAWGADHRLIGLLAEVIPHLLDPERLGEAVDRELGYGSIPGREFLDGWVPVAPETQRGMTAQVADQIFHTTGGHARPGGAVRALPTRQLHITAGNSPVIPLISLLRAFATKSAAAIKSAAEDTAVMAILAVAMHAVDPDHPITKNTSLVYWKGGDRSVEDVLFQQGAFDRILVWGSPEAVRSVAERAHGTKVIFLNPRYGLSLIGREAFDADPITAARLAVTDSMIWNQRACTSSLVHYVEGSEEQALVYCRRLQDAIAEWDRALPQQLSPATQGTIRMLKRTQMLGGRWFESGTPMQTKSAVVYMPGEFDLSCHPMCRLIVVRRVNDARNIMRYLSGHVSAIGVYPEKLRVELRDEIAACGVSNISALGDCERSYAGMPHDSMRLLSELVAWTNG